MADTGSDTQTATDKVYLPDDDGAHKLLPLIIAEEYPSVVYESKLHMYKPFQASSSFSI